MDNLMKDDEYHFSEGGSTNQSYDTAPQKSGGMNSAKRKNIFLAIGVLIIIVMVFKILGHLHANKADTSVAPVVMTPSVNKPMPALKATVPAPDLQMQSRLNSLENKVNEFNGALTGINQQLQSINTQLQSLSASSTQQQMDINALRAPTKKVFTVKAAATMQVSTKAYTIQAMVPGRAWLNSSDGNAVTIQSGDQLPGYGTVLDIVPSQAMIATSSGRVLTYSSDGS